MNINNDKSNYNYNQLPLLRNFFFNKALKRLFNQRRIFLTLY